MLVVGTFCLADYLEEILSVGVLDHGLCELAHLVCVDPSAAVGDALQNITMQNMGNTNAIVNAINGGIQSIKDQLCDYRDAQKVKIQKALRHFRIASSFIGSSDNAIPAIVRMLEEQKHARRK